MNLEKQAHLYHNILKNKKPFGLWEYVRYDRGFSEQIINKFLIGCNDKNNSITIPIYDKDFNIVDIKFRHLEGNLRYTHVKGGKLELYGWERLINNKSFIFCEGECLSDDTEVLTPNGWIFIKNYKGEKIAQWNNGKAEFVNPKGYIKKRYKGKMINFISKFGIVDLLTTPKHRILFKINGKNKTETADKVPVGVEFYQTAILKTTGIDYTEWDLRLFVIIQFNGYLLHSDDRYDYWILRLKRKTKHLKRILKELNLEYKIKNNKKNISFYIKTLRKKYSKEFPISFYQMNEQQRNIVLNEIKNWNVPVKNKYLKYNSVSEKNVDLIQWCFSMNGICAKKDICYRNNSKKILYNVLVKKNYNDEIYKKELDYDGYVYCLTVPSSYLVVRRNNSIVITGNCDRLILESNNIPAITVSGGAGTFKEEWLEYFKDKKVYFFFDNDEAGRKGVERIYSFIKDYVVLCKNIAPSILKEKEDITDYFVKYNMSVDELLLEIKKSPVLFNEEKKKYKEKNDEMPEYISEYITPSELKILNTFDFIQNNVVVKRYGNPIMALCPFHKDKDPSFAIYKKNGAHCFGCKMNFKGNIDFVMKLTGFDYNKSVKYLRNYYNMQSIKNNVLNDKNNNTNTS